MQRKKILYNIVIFPILVAAFLLLTLSCKSPQEARTASNNTPLPAFPGAEGFGAQTMGGQVIEVTNLNDSGEGSFRAAVSASGARIIVFRVSGVIQSNSTISINNPYVTIAGQTAPGGGIVVKGSGLFIRTHDVIVRGMKMYIGDGIGATSTDRDGISLWGDSAHQIRSCGGWMRIRLSGMKATTQTLRLFRGISLRRLCIAASTSTKAQRLRVVTRWVCSSNRRREAYRYIIIYLQVTMTEIQQSNQATLSF
jgi:hypothetical protein